MQKISDINVLETRRLPSPTDLLNEIPKSESQAAFVAKSRNEIERILLGQDKRFLLIIGPCSIHDLKAGREYADKLAAISKGVSDTMLILMRVYFEKPRTTVGWKGLIMDPHLDGTHDIASGFRISRRFLRDVLDLGLPTATELLDPITPQYIADLVCWSAIGARTAESQIHRQMASGLSMPIGFKNGTDGSVQTAVNAIKAAGQPHTFLGINVDGNASAVVTCGNKNCHVVLRGGTSGANYSADHILETERLLSKAGLTQSILVDCSHDNSAKQPERQPEVMRELLKQIKNGNTSLLGAMIESNLGSGNQPFPPATGSGSILERLKYGISITDGCIDWPTTESLIKEIHSVLQHARS